MFPAALAAGSGFRVHGGIAERIGEEVRLNVPEGFVCQRRGRFVLIARKGAADAAERAGALDVRDPRGWTGASPPQPKGRGAVVAVDLPGIPGRSVIVKPLLRGGIVRHLNRDIHLSPARLVREAMLSSVLKRNRVPASEMVFGRAERVYGLFFRLHLATLRIDRAVSLLEFLRDTGRAEARARDVLKTAGASVRALHDAGVLHADLNLNNLLVVPGEKGEGTRVIVIDLDNSRFGPNPSERDRAANLARLLRHAVKNNLHADANLDESGSLFMEGYCRDDDPVPLKKRILATFRRTIPLHRISWRLQGIAVQNIPFRGR